MPSGIMARVSRASAANANGREAGPCRSSLPYAPRPVPRPVALIRNRTCRRWCQSRPGGVRLLPPCGPAADLSRSVERDLQPALTSNLRDPRQLQPFPAHAESV